MPNGAGGFGVPKYVKQSEYFFDQSYEGMADIPCEDYVSPTATA